MALISLAIAALTLGQGGWPPAGATVVFGPGRPVGQSKFHAKGKVEVKNGILVIDGGTVVVGAPGMKAAGIELVLISNGDGTIATLGKTVLASKFGKLTISGPASSIPAGKIDVSKPIHLAFVSGGSVYVNGAPIAKTSVTPTFPVVIGGKGWTGALVTATTYAAPPKPAILARNATLGRQYASQFAIETDSVTIEAILGESTAVPDPNQIKPYRNALLAQEYIVQTVVEGHQEGVAKGERVRVFRWGILDGEKTSYSSHKKGDLVRMKLIKLAGNLKYEREYQVDDLDTDVSISYYVDESKTP